MPLSEKPFGTLPGETPVSLFTLSGGGLTAVISTYGGALVSLLAPDRQGRPGDVVLGYDDLAGYRADKCYFGALIGRFGNRIGDSRFTLDGKTYSLPPNEGPTHLHGGPEGFHRAVWEAGERDGGEEPFLELGHVSPNGDAGYPGNLYVTVRYTLTKDAALRIDYRAVTDAATPVNLTNHAYFNLAGADSGENILGHELTMAAPGYLPVDERLLPTGEIAQTSGTPFDFMTPAPIGARIGDDDAQLRLAGGYDHNMVLAGRSGTLRFAARVHEPKTGRVMVMETTEPGAQFYSGNFIPEGLPGKNGARYPHRGGFCLEAQHFPDSPNRPEFPCAILRPGETYAQTTVYRFETAS